jgi:hypothetical protein
MVKLIQIPRFGLEIFVRQFGRTNTAVDRILCRDHFLCRAGFSGKSWEGLRVKGSQNVMNRGDKLIRILRVSSG